MQSILSIHELRRHGRDTDTSRQVVQSHAKALVAVEGEGPDVYVLFVSLTTQDLDGPAGEILDRERQVHTKQARRFTEAPKVILGAEHEQLALFLVPERPHAGE